MTELYRRPTVLTVSMILCLLLAVPSLVKCQIEFEEPFPEVQTTAGSPCYDDRGEAQRCVPEFVNAAFNRIVVVSNTCGETRPTRFCVQTGHSGMMKTCDICDASIPEQSHPSAFLTDFNNPNNLTWWQSETMAEGVQYPNVVNLTLNLGKAFDIIYVRLKFHSPRPESFSLLKKSEPDGDWIPWQYYSASCGNTFGRDPNGFILPDNEAVAQCSQEFSDISPITGANIAFSTLEGRPSSHRFEDSPQLQDWVTATSIRIVLTRLNTYGDEVFKDEQVLRTYYYAVSDFAVGGRCKCNGHANECVKSTGAGVEKLVCRCSHNTAGEDCHQCDPFYNDRPWRPATATEANECKPCECNGMTQRCYFDEKMYDKTGHGGHCIDCAGNTRGPHCETCLEDHYRRPEERWCVACECNDVGSSSGQCDDEGQCPCHPGVDGRKCDRCKAGFYEFTSQGCKDCQCKMAGSVANQPNCSPENGDCACKENVEGKQCDRCKPGHFALSTLSDYGCTPCFCFSHSSECTSAEGYKFTNITSDFVDEIGNWTAEADNRPVEVQQYAPDGSLAVTDQFNSQQGVYFLAPDAFLGDQRASYNQLLTFTLRVSQENSRASSSDLMLVGANGKTLQAPIFAQDNNVPAPYDQTYSYRLHANPDFQWTPRLSEVEFLAVLSNLTALKIRGTFSYGDAGYLSDVTLGSASQEVDDESAVDAVWMEKCTCPEGFEGQFCEKCAKGYRRETKFGGSFNRCVKCDCHGHTELCEAESGSCLCEHNTAGDTCERCARGYYGDALKGTADDCKECPCPDGGACVMHTDNDIICLECPQGYSGRRCEMCGDGYYGNPKEKVACKPCECSGNIDSNSIGNCDQVTGECKRCVFNTHGFNCETCLDGFWGDALAEPKGDCKSCKCLPAGTVKPTADYDQLTCAQSDGQCECMPHVEGLRCDKCQPGYFNLTSGTGCQSCGCDALGSINSTCDEMTGQCRCKEGVTGRRCDECAARRFGFSADGCANCDCEVIGAESLQCDKESGQCQCKKNIEGRRCDQCVENMHNLAVGCLPCEDCYVLIQRRVNEYRVKMNKLKTVLQEIIDNPITVNDTDFDKRLEDVKVMVTELKDMVKERLSTDDAQLVSQVNQLKADLKSAMETIGSVDAIIDRADTAASDTDERLKRWETTKNRAYADLEEAQRYLETEGRDAWERASEASEKYGEQSQKLSAIAKDARKLADDHVNSSARVEEMAKKAANISTEALAKANEAIFGGEKVSQEIQNLKDKFEQAEDKYNKTQLLATNVLEEAEQGSKDARKIFAEVKRLELPDIDTREDTAKAKDLKEQAEKVTKNAAKQSEEGRQLIETARFVHAQANDSLQSATYQQQEADQLLSDVDAARGKAQEAVSLAQDTLNEANKTLVTLQGFDAAVEKSKTKALEELGKSGDIELLIEQAENRTREAKEALGGAKDDAQKAEEIANQANKDANDASSSAEQMRDKAKQTKKSAQEMKKEVNELKTRLGDANSTMKNYRDQTNTAKIKATDAVKHAAEAKLASSNANTTVQEALEKIKRILDELKSLEDPKSGELDELEKRLKEANTTLAEAQLEKYVEELKTRQTSQHRKIKQYKADVDELKKQVENVKQIRDSLPDQCFNVVNIEGQKRR